MLPKKQTQRDFRIILNKRVIEEKIPWHKIILCKMDDRRINLRARNLPKIRNFDDHFKNSN
ncbi:hypothetical protein T06_15248 [Trichinella sp. T6]|nr:hypothetical protein T06_15248 [Trichinella sp. T6]